jgi:hypothetical protein
MAAKAPALRRHPHKRRLATLVATATYLKARCGSPMTSASQPRDRSAASARRRLASGRRDQGTDRLTSMWW